jgi:heme/copper-type cytochrome/quinol oxidase subunit 1
VDRHDVGRLDRVQDADALGDRLHLPVHRRRRDRRGAGQCRRRPRLHDTYYVVAHFHYVLSLGAVFAIFAGWYYWFPKMFGYMYNETLGKAALLGDLHRRQPDLLPAALPGPAGMPRRYIDYPDAFAYWNYVSSIGSYISAAAC